jgi:hypothetical protein
MYRYIVHCTVPTKYFSVSEFGKLAATSTLAENGFLGGPCSIKILN